MTAGAGVSALASVAFTKPFAGATAQIANPTVPPLSPTHKTTLGNGFGGRLSDNLRVSFIAAINISTLG